MSAGSVQSIGVHGYDGDIACCILWNAAWWVQRAGHCYSRMWPKLSDNRASLAVSPPNEETPEPRPKRTGRHKKGICSASVCLRNAASPGEQY